MFIKADHGRQLFVIIAKCRTSLEIQVSAMVWQHQKSGCGLNLQELRCFQGDSVFQAKLKVSSSVAWPERKIISTLLQFLEIIAKNECVMF